ncbi:hypothetical protein EC9_49990 [Rosistilla ulvae]|uniref:Uncharacterized protein n=1 Tax=Rosistilla ulvae TaxID=1930277 RepID=A0A517M7D8_9BACT|nr:hypothetical protein EC9_49990 [Rosistilla ulvae]
MCVEPGRCSVGPPRKTSLDARFPTLPAFRRAGEVAQCFTLPQTKFDREGRTSEARFGEGRQCVSSLEDARLALPGKRRCTLVFRPSQRSAGRVKWRNASPSLKRSLKGRVERAKQGSGRGVSVCRASTIRGRPSPGKRRWTLVFRPSQRSAGWVKWRDASPALKRSLRAGRTSEARFGEGRQCVSSLDDSRSALRGKRRCTLVFRPSQRSAGRVKWRTSRCC